MDAIPEKIQTELRTWNFWGGIEEKNVEIPRTNYKRSGISSGVEEKLMS